MHPDPEPIAIIGIGCLFPKADGAGAFWANICARVDAVGPIPPTHWKTEDYVDPDPKAADRIYTARGAFLSHVAFPPLDFGITPNALEATDTTQLLALVAARQALHDAGYAPPRDFDRNRVGVILGVTGALELVIPLGARLGHPRWRRALKEAGVDAAVAEDVVRRIGESYVGWQEDSFPGLLGNVAAGRIANRLDLGGTNCVVDAACASSLGAIHLAILELNSGRADMVVTGGLDTFNDIFMFTCFSKTPALSPTGDARPFDASADGTILGEGLGVVILKRQADAVRDGDRVYAVIRAIGSSSDGKGNAVYAPSPAGQSKALRQAYELAGVTPDSIELVEAHGTGTRAGDAAELSALVDVYRGSGRAGTWCALGSIKSQIGHTKAAAGAAGIIKAALSLHHKVLPPTIKVTRPAELAAPGRGPFYVNVEQRPWLPSAGHPRRAAVSSFGFGGSNFHCVLEEHAAAKQQVSWDGKVQVLAFSGATRAEVGRALASFPAEAPWDEVRQAASNAREKFMGTDACRLAFVVEQETGPAGLVAKARAALERFHDRATWTTPERICFGSGAPPGKLAFLFPGQGSQYVGMLRDLACAFPQMLTALAEANEAGAGGRLSDVIYPQPVFDDDARRHLDNALRATDLAQPALGAVSLGVARVLEHFGVHPEVTAGHSFGELVALCVAGWFDPPALHRLARQRGKLMAEQSGSNRGAMLAVRATLPQVENVLQTCGLDLTIANRNAPNQCVLSGAVAAIERAAKVLAERGLETRLLSVSAAFHSPLIAAARAPLRAVLAEVAITPSRVPVFANTTADLYPQNRDAVRDLLAGQLAAPVAFVEEIVKMYQSGVRTFVEAGPGIVQSGLVGAILNGREHHALAVDASAGKRSGMVDLAGTLAQLAALGHAVQLPRWDEDARRHAPTLPRKPGMTVPICGANFVKPRKPNHAPARSPGLAPLDVEIPARSETVSASADPVAQNKVASMSQPPSAPQTPFLNEALRVTQENLQALSKLGEQAAELHRQFLAGQDRVVQTIQSVMEQQQRLVQASLGTLHAVEENGQPRPAAPSPPFNIPPTPASIQTSVPHVEPASSPSVNRPAHAGPRAGELAKILLAVVAEKTGYPAEMLELDMELDTELGIDSIKRVEIFSALQERLPEAPLVKPEHLGTLRTLRQVADFLAGSLPAALNGAASAPEEKPASAAINRPARAEPRADELAKILLAVVAEKTGYPAEMLELNMELDTELGIDSIKRVEIFSALQERLPEAPLVKPEHLGTLRTLRQVVDFLAGSQPAALNGTASAPEEKPAAVNRPARAEPLADDLSRILLSVVADKTGYPAEMLELDMELDTELGIDSIKRVEIFSALQERLPQAPTVKPEHLGTLRTLRNVVDFLAGAASPAPPEPAKVMDQPPALVTTSAVPEILQRLVLTRVPLDENKRASIELADGEIWISDDGTGLSASLAGRLNAMGRRTRLSSVTALLGQDVPARLAGLVIIAPPHVDDAFLRAAFLLLQFAAPAIRQTGKNGGAVFATVSRLDGAFGLDSARGEPLGGGLAGLAKTAGHEWSEVHCKAIDLASNFADRDEAALLVAEELECVGPVEVGIDQQGRYTLHLEARPQPASVAPTLPAAGEVVVVTGGARGVTAEVAIALARVCRPTLVLLGRSPEPAPEPAALAGCRDEAEVKRALLAQTDVKLTPRELSDRCQQILTDREIRRNLGRLTKGGAKVIYRSVDVRDPAAVAAVLAEIRAAHGPIRGLIHGAGVLADRRIEDKTVEQFERVYATKVAGLRSLLEGTEPDPLRFLVLFSSSTARYGRAGQIDYSLANEVLNKLAQQHARRHPDCRVLSINWGPWAGGMVTPGLRDLFAREGVGLIPLADGAEFLIRELNQDADRAVEVVVLGPAPAPTTEGAKPEPLLDERSPAQPLALSFERELSVEQVPVLASHVIDGRAVFPMALMVEWLAHGALHGNPGLVFHGFDGLRVLKGLRLEADETRRLGVFAGKAVKRDGVYRVPVEMRGQSLGGTEFLHSRAEIVLAERLPLLPAGANLQPPAPVPYPRDRREVYGSLLFHGPDLHGIERIETMSPEGLVVVASTGPAPASWIRQPLRTAWLADPLALDTAFHLMTLWSFEIHGAFSLPCHAGSYRQYRRTFPRGSVRVVVRLTRFTGQRALVDMDFLDMENGLIGRLEGYECVQDQALRLAFRKNQLAPAVLSR